MFLDAVLMARESNVSVIQSLQRELDAQLQQLRNYTEQDNQLNTAISALQCVKRGNALHLFLSPMVLEQRKMPYRISTMQRFMK